MASHWERQFGDGAYMTAGWSLEVYLNPHTRLRRVTQIGGDISRHVLEM